MKIGILPIGRINRALMISLGNKLGQVFPDAIFLVTSEILTLRKEGFDKKRKQYRSNAILTEIQVYANKKSDLNRVLGVVDNDISVPELNFVFGEAACPGKAALISLWRLNPEFYGDAPNMGLFLDRALKEAVHELGHTLGLRHCSTSSCVMHFSNSILDTDKKQNLFCDRCYMQAEISINNLG